MSHEAHRVQSSADPGDQALLEVRDLCVAFGRRGVPAVRDVGFTIRPGERVGLIGESGSGKSVTSLALMGLLPASAHATGSVRLAGREVLGASERELARMRGEVVGMVFQEPMTALDPTMACGRQVAEVLRIHHRDGERPARDKVLEMLERVGLPDPPRIARAYPHELSGGQRQRVLMAMALVNNPSLVICDEPTTALDVTVQARVLRVLREQLDAAGAACLFISHDLAVVSQVCDRVMVMWRGEVVEQGPMTEVLGNPRHGYTRGLLATARLDRVEPGSRLPVVEDFWDPGER